MFRRLALVALLVPGLAAAAPSTIPASLKTLESILKTVDLPASGAGGGVQPLHSAVAAADALLRSLDPNGLSGARANRPEGKEAEAETGILLGRMKGLPVVTGTLPGSPAFRTALREGDRLLQIGDHMVAATDRIDDLEAMLRGEDGESVKVRVLHADAKDTAAITLKRGKVASSVYVRTLPGNVAYVQINQPNPLVLAEYKLRIGKLPIKELSGVVLDLRGARGGRPEDAVAICDPFLEKVTVAKVLEGSSRERILEDTDPATIKSPLVVIVGPSTSGAGEIAAGALQANRRGVILGEGTQGTAPAYRQVEQSGVFLTLPKALVELPSGTLLTGRGLQPDIRVEPEAVSKKAAANFAGQLIAFAKGEKWEPPKKKSETDKELESALEGDKKPRKKPAPKKEEDEEEDEDEDGKTRPKDPFHDYGLVKRYDPRLVRSVHLLMAANIFFDQARN